MLSVKPSPTSLPAAQTSQALLKSFSSSLPARRHIHLSEKFAPSAHSKSPSSSLLCKCVSRNRERVVRDLHSPAPRRAHGLGFQRRLLIALKTAESQQVSTQQLVFRSATSPEDLYQASALRAEAYYEERPHARYVDSFKKQFTEQSVSMLRQQTARSLNAATPECACLVAILPENQQVLATCDIRPPAEVAGQHPKGVPDHDRHAAYVTNVAVDSKSRGQGLGFQLLEAAAAFAAEEWQAQTLYTTVDSANQAASSLYAKCGFEFEHHKDTDNGGKSDSGRLALLRASLPLKCEI